MQVHYALHYAGSNQISICLQKVFSNPGSAKNYNAHTFKQQVTRWPNNICFQKGVMGDFKGGFDAPPPYNMAVGQVSQLMDMSILYWKQGVFDVASSILG